MVQTDFLRNTAFLVVEWQSKSPGLGKSAVSEAATTVDANPGERIHAGCDTEDDSSLKVRARRNAPSAGCTMASGRSSVTTMVANVPTTLKVPTRTASVRIL